MGKKSIVVSASLETEKILLLMREKYDLKEDRKTLVELIRKKRKELYNLSRQINDLELRLDKIMIDKLNLK